MRAKMEKPPILINKVTQGYERTHTYEFRLHFPIDDQRLKQPGDFADVKLTSTKGGDVCLFANTAEERDEWVKHLQYMYERTILELLNKSIESSSESEMDIFNRKKPKDKDPSKQRKVEILPAD